MAEEPESAEGYEMIYPMPLQDCVTAKYIYLAVAKTWGDSELRHNRSTLHGGITFTPPLTEQLIVAFPREGKEALAEELREGAVTFEEFVSLLQQQRQLHKEFHTEHIESAEEGGF